MEIYRLQLLDTVLCLIIEQSPTSFVRWWHIPSFWPVLCLFPRRSLFPRSLLASVRRLLAEIHAAQKGRAFQLSATNPLCQLSLMLQCEIWKHVAGWNIKKNKKNKNSHQNLRGHSISVMVALQRHVRLPPSMRVCQANAAWCGRKES